MSVFKQQADLRAQGLRLLLHEMEQERDKVLDELAEKKGRASQLEALITRAYEMILDINKDEQNREIAHLAEMAERKRLDEEKEKRDKEREAFETAKRGIKTPKLPRRQRGE